MAAAAFRITILAAAGAFASCTSISATNSTLEGTHWQVTAIDGRSTPRTESYRVRFRGGHAGGRFGCNHFGAQFAVHGDTLVMTDTASTLMGCTEPTATFEREGLAVLQQPMRMSWKSDRQLTLSNGAGSITLERLP